MAISNKSLNGVSAKRSVSEAKLTRSGVSSALIWRGPSAFDEQPIMAVVTGLDGSSENPKTGPMAQLWIQRSDIHPIEAVQSRGDYSICSDCKLRGSGLQRPCYVKLEAPTSIYNKFRRGGYQELTPTQVNAMLRQSGRGIRLGAYGDPVACPIEVIRELVEGVRFTGYTHQWASPLKTGWRSLLMASCDSPLERLEASKRGWRTFRVRLADESLMAAEIACPASDEAGHRTICQKCGLCDGARANDRRKDIAIIVHGVQKAQFMEIQR
jgi:hypothetical protein